MTPHDTAIFIIFYLWIAGMIIAFLWTIRELWHLYSELWDDKPHQPLEHGKGDATEEVDYPNVWRRRR